MEVEIEPIGEGGFGDEAQIEVQARRVFPGIGGTIQTRQALVVAVRREYSPSPWCGHRQFLLHALLKKLEDVFFVEGLYRYPHITRPLGSTDEEYIYEWAFGSDGFSWEYLDDEGRRNLLELDEWQQFLTAFNTVGIDMSVDCTDPDDGRVAKNIVHQWAKLYISQPQLNRIWKRIDFGERSIRVDYDKLRKYLIDREQDLRAELQSGRYEFLRLACGLLDQACKMEEGDLGKLEILVFDYRLSTLAHLNARGMEPSPQWGIRLEKHQEG